MDNIALILLGILILMTWERMENSSWLYRKVKWIHNKRMKFLYWYKNRGD